MRKVLVTLLVICVVVFNHAKVLAACSIEYARVGDGSTTGIGIASAGAINRDLEKCYDEGLLIGLLVGAGVVLVGAIAIYSIPKSDSDASSYAGSQINYNDGSFYYRPEIDFTDERKTIGLKTGFNW